MADSHAQTKETTRSQRPEGREWLETLSEASAFPRN